MRSRKRNLEVTESLQSGFRLSLVNVLIGGATFCYQRDDDSGLFCVTAHRLPQLGKRRTSVWEVEGSSPSSEKKGKNTQRLKNNLGVRAAFEMVSVDT